MSTATGDVWPTRNWWRAIVRRIDTVKELRNRNSENLTKKMEEVNAEKKLVRSLPNLEKVQDWVAQAKEMEPMVTY